MDTRQVVRGRFVAIATSETHLYAALPGQIRVYARSDWGLERTFSTGKSGIKLAWVSKAKALAVIADGHCSIYSEDGRDVLLKFPTTSAAHLSASSTCVAVLSKRRLRWTWSVPEGWTEIEQLALPERGSALSVSHTGAAVTAAVGSQILAIDLDARVVRQVAPIKNGKRLGFSIASTADGCVVSAGPQLWVIKRLRIVASTVLSEPATAVYWLPERFFLVVTKSGLELRDLDTAATVTTLPTKVLDAADKYILTPDGISEVQLDIDVDTVLNMLKQNADLAVSLLDAVVSSDDDRVSELRFQCAQQMLQQKNWEKAMDLFSQSQTPPSKVAPELSKVLDEYETDETLSSTQPLSSPSSTVNSAAASIASFATSVDRFMVPAIEAFVPYLTRHRRRITIESAKNGATKDHEKELTAIDNVLFRCYLLNKSSLIGALVCQPNHCDADMVLEKLSKAGRWRELVGFLKTRKMHRKALETLSKHGTSQSIIDYLEHQGEFSLVKEFAVKPLRQDPGLTKDLFFDHSSRFEPEEVYHFLLSIDSPKLLDFLVFQIDDMGSTNSQLHQDLAVFYLENGMVKQLDEFLPRSHCNPHELLPKVPQKLYYTRALLYGKLGQHEKVIDTLVKHKDFDRVKEYCTRTCESNPAEGRVALQYLYDVVSSKYPEHLVPLLNSEGHRLDPASTVAKLPDNLKMNELSSFFNNQRAQIADSRTSGLLINALSKEYLSESTYSAVLAKDKRVVVTSSTTCDWCRKRLGLSVIGVFKDRVVHYGCLGALRSSIP